MDDRIQDRDAGLGGEAPRHPPHDRRATPDEVGHSLAAQGAQRGIEGEAAGAPRQLRHVAQRALRRGHRGGARPRTGDR